MTYIIITTFNFSREFDNTGEGREKVYDVIAKLTDDELLAIEVSSWCELATIGETFENEQFVAEIFGDTI